MIRTTYTKKSDAQYECDITDLCVYHKNWKSRTDLRYNITNAIKAVTKSISESLDFSKDIITLTIEVGRIADDDFKQSVVEAIQSADTIPYSGDFRGERKRYNRWAFVCADRIILRYHRIVDDVGSLKLGTVNLGKLEVITEVQPQIICDGDITNPESRSQLIIVCNVMTIDNGGATHGRRRFIVDLDENCLWYRGEKQEILNGQSIIDLVTQLLTKLY